MSSNDTDYVPHYYSEEEDEVIPNKENNAPSQRQQRGQAKEYTMSNSFQNLESAKESIKNENRHWNLKTKYDTIDGIKYSYKCAKNCPKKAYIICPHENAQAQLYFTKDDHNHTDHQPRGW